MKKCFYLIVIIISYFSFLISHSSCTQDAYDKGEGKYSLMRADFVEAHANAEKKIDQIITDEGEQLLAKAAGASLEQLKGMNEAVSDSVKRVSFSSPAYVAALGGSETIFSADALVGKQGVASAPLKGNYGVYVLEPYAQNKTNDTYDAAVEKQTLQNNKVNIARQQFGNDLYQKANVKDTRYLFF